MASCVGVLSWSNSPLFVRSSDSERQLADQYALHTSLDVIEEKTSSSLTLHAVANKKVIEQQTRELYLGVLFATEKQKVFGYVTNTRIKFIIIVDASNVGLRDNEIRQMFRKLHTAYTQLLSNPFYTPGEPIESQKFGQIVQGLMART
ncbi:hypothetical protein TCAL_04523 [Tigriopus californicus]|uniref:Trafficking protein particle complex subunit 2-like protein n=1 Tax=Tigriopus californicus TaxID=6832 RepID=A0A553PD11_TIGCA|nr:trafficking protein particle complex subunit 2-like protein [Tigriopus californicus]TRY75565.1 hypothetical protein TCAL_04523 [Tigriopus californicus]|eukprot:TCALIF_04523-PB protein Name:"Similar to trappc2l Trafficking protein particle complex subunit 2-like protein (Xenopus tropicalis)" AED:0.03 eAED:0.03 QI:111/1/1/1/0.66/0.25/4/2707/147